MRTDTPQAIYRKNYTPPSFFVDTVEIGFDLDPKATRVASRLTMRRNPVAKDRALVLFGEDLELVQIRMNGKVLAKQCTRCGHS